MAGVVYLPSEMTATWACRQCGSTVASEHRDRHADWHWLVARSILDGGTTNLLPAERPPWREQQPDIPG